MTITTIYRVHFDWHEYSLMAKFEQESPEFRIVSQDSRGTLYELRKDILVEAEKDKE